MSGIILNFLLMFLMNPKVVQQLHQSSIAKNDYKKGYIEFLQINYCETEIEKAIIERVLNKALTQSTYKRQRAHYMNVLHGVNPREDIVAKRQKQNLKIKEEIKSDTKGLFDGLARFFKKLN